MHAVITHHRGPVPTILGVVVDGRSLAVRLHLASDEHHPGQGPSPGGGRCHSHAVFHLVLYTHGDGAFVLDGRRHPAGPGTLVLVDPDHPHRFGPVARSPTRYRSLTFSLDEAPAQYGWSDYLAAWLGHRQVTLPSISRLSAPATRAMADALQAVIDQIHRSAGNGAEPAMHLAVATVLVHLAQELIPDDRPTCVDADLLAAWDDIHRHFREPMSITDLATRAGCSSGHFHRRFKTAFNRTPMALIIDLRLRCAVELLRTTALPIAAIAAQSGFTDRGQLTRLFTRHLKASPRCFRRMSGQG